MGTGCGLELNRWAQPGDVIELEIEKIGVLRNRVMRSSNIVNTLQKGFDKGGVHVSAE